MEANILDLKNKINDLIILYNEYNDLWKASSDIKCNFSKKLVKDFNDDNDLT